MQSLPALLVWLLKSERLVVVCIHAGRPEPDILVTLFLCPAGSCPIAMCHPSFTTASSAVFSGFRGSASLSYQGFQCSVAQLCLTLCDPHGLEAHWAPLSMEISRQEYWSGLPFPPPGDLPHPGTEPTSPALAGRFFTTVSLGKPRHGFQYVK